MERLSQFSSSRIRIGADGAISPAPALKTFSTNDETPLSPHQVSQVCDAISFLLTELGMPPELRGFVVAVIGAAAGQEDFFELKDLDLAKRLWKEVGVKDDSLKKRVSRLRDELTAWQIETGLTVLTYLQGDKIDGKNLATQYRVDCLGLVGSTLEIAALAVNFDTNPGDAFRQAAVDIAKGERYRLLTPPKRQRRPRPKPRADQYLKCIETYTAKYTAGRFDLDTAYDEIHAAVEEHRLRSRNPNFPQVVDSTTKVWVDRSVHPDPEAAREGKSAQAGTSNFVHGINPLRNMVDKIDDLEPELAADRGDGRDGDEEERRPPVILNPEVIPASIEVLQEGSCDDAQQGLEQSDIEGAEIEGNFSELVNFLAEMSGAGETSAALREDEAVTAADAFWSVGAHPDQVLFKNDATGAVDVRDVTDDDLSVNLGAWIADAERRGQSFIVRLRGDGLIQVDDCDQESREFLEPLAFLTVETSPGSFQAWLAVDGVDLEQTRRRIFLGLAQRGMEGNGGSYGSLRWPGSINFKPERRGPGGSPIVRVMTTQSGCRVTLEELASFSLLPELPAAAPSLPVFDPRQFAGPQKWPDYGKCLAVKRTRSEADAQFVWIALQRGFSDSEIAAKLAEVSEIGRKGPRATRYIERTIREVKAWAGR